MSDAIDLSEGRYEETTGSVTVSVKPIFLPHQSEPDERRWVWAYHVRIENHGGEIVQLISRHWRITDATGHVVEVRGEGVVGEQPRLKPGESFEYTSGTPLSTPSGIMAGSYQMVTRAGQSFEVAIPPFSLDAAEWPLSMRVITPITVLSATFGLIFSRSRFGELLALIVSSTYGICLVLMFTAKKVKYPPIDKPDQDLNRAQRRKRKRK